MKSHLGLRILFLAMAVLAARLIAMAHEFRAAHGVLAWAALPQDDATTHYNLGYSLQAKGDLDGAIAEYRKAIAQQPNFPQAHGNLGSALRAKGDLDGAIAEYRTAIAQNTNLPEPHFNLGISLAAKGDLDAGIAELRIAISQRPNYPLAHLGLGRLLAAKHQMDDAIAEFRTAIVQQPNYPEAHYNLGNAFGAKGDFEAAATELRIAIDQRPNYPEAQANLKMALDVQSKINAGAGEPTSAPKLSITFANKPWILAFDAKDFDVKTNEVQPDGRAYLLAENQKMNITLSVYLEKVSGGATETDCDETQKQRLDEKVEYEREMVVTKKSAGMTIVEYTIPEFQGVPVQQRNLFACLPKDDVFADIHLSKVAFKPQDEKLLTDVLNSAHFVQKP